MAHLHTTYEIAAIHDSGRRLLVVYAYRKTTKRLIEAIRERYAGLALATATDLDRVTDVKGGSYPSCRYGEWTIRYTGRTQIQAKQEGELRSIVEAAADPDAIVLEADAAVASVA